MSMGSSPPALGPAHGAEGRRSPPIDQCDPGAIEGIAVILLVVALVLGRWWRATLPGLVLLAVVGWIWLYNETDGALYGDGRQDDGFWLIAGLASVFAVFLGVAIHQIGASALRALRRV